MEKQRGSEELPELTRRTAVVAVGSAFAAAITGCGPPARGRPNRGSSTAPTSAASSEPANPPTGRPIGDGSTSDTGPQPNQPKLPPLRPGQAPPQFVVFSWDGGAETDNHLLTRFRSVMKDVGGSMTIFLTGLYVLRGRDARVYRPPRNPVGASDIPFLSDASVRRTIQGIGQAWREGHEIGTHFNGHFCSTPGSVAYWSSADWRSEIDQALWMVTHWRTTTGWTDLPALPFDYTRELIGGRTPCLLGEKALIPAATTLGWRYSSSTGGNQVWPTHFEGTTIWDVPLSLIPFPGHTYQVIAMDYNYMANQSGPQPVSETKDYAKWMAQSIGALRAGFDRAHDGNRAPLIVGNHFETWNGGIYMNAVEAAMRTFATEPETHLISFRQLVDWLDAQDPALVSALQALPVGSSPEGGWATFGVHATTIDGE